MKTVPSVDLYNAQNVTLEVWMMSESASYLEKDINERLEVLVCGIVKCIPYVGSAISGVIGFFWPASEPDPYAVWNEVKGYILSLIEDVISKEKVKSLENQLQGIHSALADYQDASLGTPEKGQWFTSVLAAIDLAEPFFFNEEHPEETIPYFVAMGTIKISTLREQYLFYKDIYLVEDINKDKHLQKVKDVIQKYRDAANKAKKAALDWRLGLITSDYREEQVWGLFGPHKKHIWSVKDNHVTDKMNPHPDYEKSWECDDLTGGTADGQERATWTYNRRRDQIAAEMASKLDAFLNPTFLWNYLDPTNNNQPQKKPVDFASGPYGPYAGYKGQQFCDDARGERITRVAIQADSLVKGVEIFYGGRSGGVHGVKPDGYGCRSLDLQDEESIVQVYGRAGDSIDALFFKTDKGRIIGGGGSGGSEWSASPPEGTGATLTFISGIQGNESLDSITLHWRYWRYE